MKSATGTSSAPAAGSASLESLKSRRDPRWVGALVAGILLTQVANLGVGWWLWKHRASQSVLATVSGVPIRQRDLDLELNSSYGAEELTQIIIERTILTSAAKAEILPTAAEVDEELDRALAAEPDLLYQLAGRQISEETLRRDILGRLAMRNLRVRPVQVTEQQVRSFYQANRSQFVIPARIVGELVIVPSPDQAPAVREMLLGGMAARQVANQFNGSLPDTEGHRVSISAGILDPQTEAALMSLRPGEVSAALPFAEGIGVIRVIEKRKEQKLTFDQARERAEIALRLTLAPPESVTLDRLLSEAKVNLKSDRYRAPVKRWLFPEAPVRVAQDG